MPQPSDAAATSRTDDDLKDDMFVLNDLIPAAKEKGKWLHMGRVNGRRRLRVAVHSGCDSVDGSSLSRFPRTWIPPLVAMARELEQEAAGLDRLNAYYESLIRYYDARTPDLLDVA